MEWKLLHLLWFVIQVKMRLRLRLRRKMEKFTLPMDGLNWRIFITFLLALGSQSFMLDATCFYSVEKPWSTRSFFILSLVLRKELSWNAWPRTLQGTPTFLMPLLLTFFQGNFTTPMTRNWPLMMLTLVNRWYIVRISLILF